VTEGAQAGFEDKAQQRQGRASRLASLRIPGGIIPVARAGSSVKPPRCGRLPQRELPRRWTRMDMERCADGVPGPVGSLGGAGMTFGTAAPLVVVSGRVTAKLPVHGIWAYIHMSVQSV
jgi:hypothetical protein